MLDNFFLKVDHIIFQDHVIIYLQIHSTSYLVCQGQNGQKNRGIEFVIVQIDPKYFSHHLLHNGYDVSNQNLMRSKTNKLHQKANCSWLKNPIHNNLVLLRKSFQRCHHLSGGGVFWIWKYPVSNEQWGHQVHHDRRLIRSRFFFQENHEWSVCFLSLLK